LNLLDSRGKVNKKLKGMIKNSILRIGDLIKTLKICINNNAIPMELITCTSFLNRFPAVDIL
jgi:hypothetical protein